MNAQIYTRRLVEHRYGSPLEKLHRGIASDRSDDPVLPILLRRLDGLAQTGADAQSARRNLETARRGHRSGEPAFDDLVLLYAAEVVDLERQEQSEVEAVWDLLDVRLLLDRGSARRPSGHRVAHAPDDQELLDVAREVAAGLQRLNCEALRRGLRERGVHVSNRRLGVVLQRLRTESAFR
ncbi:hypothetical protein [Streptomyces sp. DW26H14]|uniref:hypothetical protein n=1 Tax=Streptomyces sp. DW26H14 TaxID=3435395 RepID=UPI00403DAD08